MQEEAIMSEVIVRFTTNDDGMVSVYVRRGGRIFGRWTRPTTEHGWAKVEEPIFWWVDACQQVAYIDMQHEMRTAAAERRAAGLPDWSRSKSTGVGRRALGDARVVVGRGVAEANQPKKQPTCGRNGSSNGMRVPL
jgi:hypothetical protein